MYYLISKIKSKDPYLFKKAYWVVYGTLFFFTFFIAALDFYYDIYISAYAALFCYLGYAVSMYFMLAKKNALYAVYMIYFTLGPAVVLASYFEGLLSGNIWYVFAMLYATPFIVRKEGNYKKAIKFLSIVSICYIILAILISPLFSTYYPDTPRTFTLIKLVISSTVSFMIIMIFSFVATKTVEIYLKRIFKEKERAEIEKENRTRVLANLGHELRTQINGINGVSQLILERDKKGGYKNNYGEILEYCNNNMLELVNDMLDLHKIESGKFKLFYQPKQLGRLLHKATMPFKNKAKENSVLLETYVDELLEDKIVMIDETRLMQVIHNLLSNALKFTLKGKIVFTSSLISESEDKIHVKFSVQDTGIGISEDNFDKIFDSFLQVKDENNPIYGGTGLGLTISKTIIEKMGSQINVKSQLNKGSTFDFTICFDKLEKEAINFEAETILNKDHFYDKNILVVEDNKISMMYAKKLLTNFGVSVFQAENGLKAIAQVNKHKNLDIVLLDLEMPVMNGFDAIIKIKECNPNLVVIAFTANIPSKELLERIFSLGFDDIISKPFKQEDMLKVLTKYLNLNLALQ